MPDTLPPIARLRQVVEAVQAGEPVPPDAAGWFAAAVRRYETGLGTVGLDVALGLGKPGAHGWWTKEAEAARNAALMDVWRRHYPTLDAKEAGAVIAAAARARSPLLASAAAHGAIPGARQVANILRKSATPALFSGGISGSVI